MSFFLIPSKSQTVYPLKEKPGNEYLYNNEYCSFEGIWRERCKIWSPTILLLSFTSSKFRFV